MTAVAHLRRWAAVLRAQTVALYIASKDPRTPWYAKWLVVAIVAYALSPIDLIPDFIPIVGLLDDLILVPVGLAIAVRIIPHDILRESRRKARTFQLSASVEGRVAAAGIIATWLVVCAVAVAWGVRRFLA